MSKNIANPLIIRQFFQSFCRNLEDDPSPSSSNWFFRSSSNVLHMHHRDHRTPQSCCCHLLSRHPSLPSSESAARPVSPSLALLNLPDPKWSCRFATFCCGGRSGAKDESSLLVHFQPPPALRRLRSTSILHPNLVPGHCWVPISHKEMGIASSMQTRIGANLNFEQKIIPETRAFGFNTKVESK